MCLELPPLLTPATYIIRKERVEGYSQSLPVARELDTGNYKIFINAHPLEERLNEHTIVCSHRFALHYGMYNLILPSWETYGKFFHVPPLRRRRKKVSKIKMILRVANYVYEHPTAGEAGCLTTVPWHERTARPQEQEEGNEEQERTGWGSQKAVQEEQ